MNAKLHFIEGDATKPQRLDASARVYLPHCCNDKGGWGSGFVNAITARFSEIPRGMYKYWHSGQRGAEINANFDAGTADDDDTTNIRVITQTRFVLGGNQIIQLKDNIVLVNMIGQHDYGKDSETEIVYKGEVTKVFRPPVRYGALAKAMTGLMDFIESTHMLEDVMGSNSPFEIHCPKFGSDLAGGDWRIIESMIAEIWVDRGANVVVYEWVK